MHRPMNVKLCTLPVPAVHFKTFCVTCRLITSVKIFKKKKKIILTAKFPLPFISVRSLFCLWIFRIHSVQNLPSCSLLSISLKAKIYRIIILLVVLHGCETWSLTLREEHRLRVSENRVLRKIFGPKRDEVTGSGENHIMRSLMICIPHPILCGL